jgi:hypothetical protein
MEKIAITTPDYPTNGTGLDDLSAWPPTART